MIRLVRRLLSRLRAPAPRPAFDAVLQSLLRDRPELVLSVDAFERSLHTNPRSIES